MSGSAQDEASAAVVEPFTVEAIEEQIKRAWSDLGAEAERNGEIAPLRTSILTLVVLAPGPREIQRASATLERLVQVMPSRVIQISIDESTSVMSGHVSAQCATRSTDKTGCYELIHIKAGPGDLRAMPSVLTQLDISDLTTFVWWAGPVDPQSAEFRRISEFAERVIIDSSLYEFPPLAFQSYRRFLTDQGDNIAGSDLTWSRLLPLRELVAQSFDAPAALDMLRDISRIDISHHAGATADAMLMTGWLMSRLGFTSHSATPAQGSVRFGMRREDGRELQVVMESVTSSHLGLRSIRMLGHSTQLSSRVAIRRIEDSRASVNIDVTGAPRQQRVVHCVDASADQLLGMELIQFGRDPIFEEALTSAAELSRLLQNRG